MPCCAGSACDDCARTGIVESEGSRCPVCSEVANPEELIPYRLFRDKVEKFRNQTGYTKTTVPPVTTLAATLLSKPTLPDIVLPDPSNSQFNSLVKPATGQPKVEPPNLNFTLAPTNAISATSVRSPPISPKERATTPKQPPR